MPRNLFGHVDGYIDGNLVGWAASDDPADNILVRIYRRGTLISEVTPHIQRGDIVELYGEGLHGFVLKAISPQDNYTDALDTEVFVENTHGDRIRIDWARGLKDLALNDRAEAEIDRILSSVVCDFDARQIRYLLDRLTQGQKLSLPERAVIGQAMRNLPFAYPAIPEQLSPIFAPVGTKSPDGDISLGKEGFVFLEEGSNRIREQYNCSIKDKEVMGRANRWSVLIASRSKALSKLKCIYIQLIFPEKNSVVGHYAAPPFTGTSAVYELIEIYQRNKKFYTSTLDVALSSARRDDFFFRTDSHFSRIGAYEVFCSILEKTGLAAPLEIVWNEKSSPHSGDIGSRVFGFPLYELAADPVSEKLEELVQSRQLVSQFAPPNEAHIGRSAEWRQKNAPIPLRVLVFGNSFFDAGFECSKLSWWFSNYFAAFKFVWSPDLLLEEVRDFKPDLVICQTIERFLTQYPKT